MDPRVADHPTVPHLLRSGGEHFGDLTCMATSIDRLTYAELNQRSARLAAHLTGLGVGKGTRVAILFPNNIDWVVAWAAVTRIGAVAAPVNTFSRSRELATFLRHADVQVLIGVPGFARHDYVSDLEEAVPGLADASGAPLLLPALPQLRHVLFRGTSLPGWAEPWPDPTHQPAQQLSAVSAAMEDDVTPADVMLVTYTSGSTGDPKGVIHGHGPLIRHAAALAQLSELDSSTRIWTPMPLCWVGGFVFCLLRALVSGGALLTEEMFDAGDALAMLERERATVVSAWPAVTKALIDHPDFSRTDLGALRSGLYEALPVDRRPPDAGLQVGSIGMSETAGPHTFKSAAEDRYGSPEAYRGTFGHAVPGIEHRIVDPDTGRDLLAGEEGEVLVRGHSLMLGLHKRERTQTFDAEGWYHTGDRGLFREGWFFFTGRATDVIKTGGANVSPSEVEQCLMGDDGVKVAFVVGVSDPIKGQRVVGLVVPWRSGEGALDVEGLRARARRHLSSFKVPERIVVITDEQVPLLTSLKPDRRSLGALAERLVAGGDG